MQGFISIIIQHLLVNKQEASAILYQKNCKIKYNRINIDMNSTQVY